MAFDEFDTLDEELARVFSGISAPATLSSSVMNRVRIPAPTRLPDFLDAIGWAGILALAASVTFFVILK